MNKKRTEFYVEGVGNINSIEEMSEKAGVSVAIVLKRRGLGATDEEIFYNSLVSYKAFKKQFSSIADFKKEYGVKTKQANLIRKLHKGATLEEIYIEETKNIKPDYYIKSNSLGVEIIVNGVKYSSTKEAIKILKPEANENAIRQRLKSKGKNAWTNEEAFEVVERKRTRTNINTNKKAG